MVGTGFGDVAPHPRTSCSTGDTAGDYRRPLGRNRSSGGSIGSILLGKHGHGDPQRQILFVVRLGCFQITKGHLD